MEILLKLTELLLLTQKCLVKNVFLGYISCLCQTWSHNNAQLLLHAAITTIVVEKMY